MYFLLHSDILLHGDKSVIAFEKTKSKGTFFIAYYKEVTLISSVLNVLRSLT